MGVKIMETRSSGSSLFDKYSTDLLSENNGEALQRRLSQSYHYALLYLKLENFFFFFLVRHLKYISLSIW